MPPRPRLGSSIMPLPSRGGLALPRRRPHAPSVQCPHPRGIASAISATSIRTTMLASRLLPDPTPDRTSVGLHSNPLAHYRRPPQSQRRRALHASIPRRRVQDFLLADVGEGITECEIIKWFVQPGAEVQEFDPVCEVQSDKASVEITSRYEGKVTELCYGVGDVARVGQPLCRIEMRGEDEGEGEGEVGVAEEGAVGHKAEDARAQPSSQGGRADDVVQTPARDRGPAASSAANRRNLHPLDPRSTAAAAAADVDRPATGQPGKLATPAVRRLTRENAIDLAHVPGTGKDGRVLKEDVLAYLAKAGGRDGGAVTDSLPHLPSPPAPPPPHAAAASAAQTSQEVGGGAAADVAQPPATTRVSLSPMRRAMFRAMTTTWVVPHFGYSDELDVTELESVRLRASRACGERLTMLPFLVKALSLVLDAHPLFRSTLDVGASSSSSSPCPSPSADSSSSSAPPPTPTLLQRESHDVSIALSSPHGLVTPSLGDVRGATVLELARRIADLQSRASSERGLGREELLASRGATLTLSNVGVVGGTGAAPLLPPTGQLAIGAVGRSRWLPRYHVVVDDADARAGAPAANARPPSSSSSSSPPGAESLTPRLILPASFAADHRVVEGVELARLVADWKRTVENPATWLLALR